MTPWASRSRGSGLVSRVDRPLSADRLSRAGTLTSLFARSVACAPKAVAVTSGQRSLTYGELDAASDRLARVIVGMDVVAGERVAVAARRSIEGLVGFVGVLKAGAAYVPVDPSDPPAHTGFILEDTAARCVLVGPEGLGRLDAHGLPAVPLGAGLGGPRATGHDGPHPGPGPGPGDLAYVVYTSGSSGRPKGVMIEHRQVLARVEGAADLMPGPGEGMLQVSRLDFDAQTWEIWGALASGARLVVVPPGDPDPDQVAALIVDERVGVALLSPGLFRQMAETHLDELGRLRLLLVGGDVLSPSHAQRFVEAHPGRRLVNLFGPTEVTVCGSSYQLPRLPDHEPVPVGRALGNTSLYILDDRGDPVSPGEPGELYIGGGGVGRGYLNRASDTAERFLDDPFGPSPGGRMYRTGDRVRLRPDGEMAFLGRDDVAGQDPWLSGRAGGGGGLHPVGRRGQRSGGHRPRGPCGPPPAGGLCRARRGSTGRHRGPAGVRGRPAAGPDGAVGLRGPDRAPPHRPGQDRPRRVAPARRRGGERTPTGPGPGDRGRGRRRLGRGARARPGRGRRGLSRARRGLAPGRPGGRRPARAARGGPCAAGRLRRVDGGRPVSPDRALGGRGGLRRPRTPAGAGFPAARRRRRAGDDDPGPGDPHLRDGRGVGPLPVRGARPLPRSPRRGDPRGRARPHPRTPRAPPHPFRPPLGELAPGGGARGAGVVAGGRPLPGRGPRRSVRPAGRRASSPSASPSTRYR